MRLFRICALCIVLQSCAPFSNVYCNEEEALDETSIQELQNIHSFFYMSTERDFDSLLSQGKKDNQVFSAVSYREQDEQNTQEAVFYKRLIAILLSNLAVQRDDDRLSGTISIEGSSSQFEYLRNFINGQGSIREVDRILSNVIKHSELSACHYMAEVSYYLNLLSEYMIHYLSVMKEHWDITIISISVISCFLIFRRQRWSRGLVIFLIIDVIFVMSFFITWWRLIQEAEIKLMAAQAQFAEMPIACQPHKMGFWDKMIASVWSTNDCEKYYATIMTDPRLQVTPALALTYFLSSTIFQPLSYFGLVISEFIDNATSKLNFIYKAPVTVALFLSFCVCIILLPFFLLGGSINFGLGPFLRFGMKGRRTDCNTKERIDRIYEHTSPKKKLKAPDKIKQITLEQDPAGGDAGTDMHYPYKKDEENEECVVENDRVKERDGDC